MIAIQPIEASHAPLLSELFVRNRAFLAPFWPDRPESFFTPAGQDQRLAAFEAQRRADAAYPFLILEDDEPVGTITLSNVVRGPFQSATVGYWVDQAHNGRGIAKEAVRLLAVHSFEVLHLHRLEASTLLHNHASQRVLAANRFERIGVARSYLHIAGAWRDHLLFQRTVER